MKRASLGIFLGLFGIASALAACSGTEFLDTGAGGTSATSTTSSSDGGAGGATTSTTSTTSTSTTTGVGGGGSGAGGSGTGGTGGAGGSGTGGTGGVGGSGTGGTGGAGGSGTGGTGGVGGSGTGGTGGAGGGPGGVSCVWGLGSNPCPAGQYCEAPGCGQGVCEPIPFIENKAKSAVCGCDDVTYWNQTVAASHGMAVAGAGECQVPKSCGGFANLQCPAKTYCNRGGASAAVCQISDVGGVCWGMPATCPLVAGNTYENRACNAAVCAEECSLVKSGNAFYHDVCAP